MAESYSCRPSELLGVEDPYAAWCLDEVAYTWGLSVMAATERARATVDDVKEGNRAASAELERLLRDHEEEASDEDTAPPKGRFRDPAPEFAAVRALRRP